MEKCKKLTQCNLDYWSRFPTPPCIQIRPFSYDFEVLPFGGGIYFPAPLMMDLTMKLAWPQVSEERQHITTKLSLKRHHMFPPASFELLPTPWEDPVCPKCPCLSLVYSKPQVTHGPEKITNMEADMGPNCTLEPIPANLSLYHPAPWLIY